MNAIVDEAGELVKTFDYDVFGALRTGGTPYGNNKLQFAGGVGHPTDTDSGLIYMRARYYDPASGRFISEDPSYQGTNWYGYCYNNPINYRDPDGKGPLGLPTTIGGMVVASAQIMALLAFIAYARSMPQPEDLENAYGALMAGIDATSTLSNIFSAMGAVDLGLDLLSGNYASAFANYMSISMGVRVEYGVLLIAYAIRLEYYVNLIDADW